MPELSVIYETENFCAINKPPGIMVEQVRAAGAIVPSDRAKVVQGWLDARCPGARLVHRLDKDTSGILLAAKTPEYFEYLKLLFRQRAIQKIYYALVYGRLKNKKGVIDVPLGIKSGMTRHTVHSGGKDMRSSITEYRVLQSYQMRSRKIGDESISLLEVRPKTGRTHQIRVHLNSIHHPVLGDTLYGGNKLANIAPRQMLHALSVEFTLKDGGRIRLEASLPEDFENVLARFSLVE